MSTSTITVAVAPGDPNGPRLLRRVAEVLEELAGDDSRPAPAKKNAPAAEHPRRRPVQPKMPTPEQLASANVTVLDIAAAQRDLRRRGAR